MSGSGSALPPTSADLIVSASVPNAHKRTPSLGSRARMMDRSTQIRIASIDDAEFVTALLIATYPVLFRDAYPPDLLALALNQIEPGAASFGQFLRCREAQSPNRRMWRMVRRKARKRRDCHWARSCSPFRHPSRLDPSRRRAGDPFAMRRTGERARHSDSRMPFQPCRRSVLPLKRVRLDWQDPRRVRAGRELSRRSHATVDR